MLSNILKDAFERELEEESFIKGKADHLVSINRQFQWFRFNFIGHKVGGRLKTLDDKDEESLEAQWYPVADLLNGRLKLRYIGLSNKRKKSLCRRDF